MTAGELELPEEVGEGRGPDSSHRWQVRLSLEALGQGQLLLGDQKGRRSCRAGGGAVSFPLLPESPPEPPSTAVIQAGLPLWASLLSTGLSTRSFLLFHWQPGPQCLPCVPAPARNCKPVKISPCRKTLLLGLLHVKIFS